MTPSTVITDRNYRSSCGCTHLYGVLSRLSVTLRKGYTMLTQADIAKIKRMIVAEIRQRSRKPPRIPRKTGNNSQSFDSKIIKLCTRPNGAKRSRLEKIRGFSASTSTLGNLRPVAKRHRYQIVARGPKGKTEYHFEKLQRTAP
jgi:hypothetical protein